jgi:hypothetical protein
MGLGWTGDDAKAEQVRLRARRRELLRLARKLSDPLHRATAAEHDDLRAQLTAHKEALANFRYRYPNIRSA